MEGEERGIFGRARPRQIDLDRLENARGRTVKHENAIGEESRLQGAVGYEQSSGRLGLPQLLQQESQAPRGQFVQGAERLIEQHDRGLDRESAGQGDALPLPARERQGISMGVIGEPHGGQHLAAAALIRTSRIDRDTDVISRREPIEEARLLKYHADARLALPVDPHRAAIRRVESGREMEQRRLADAGTPDQRDQLARRQLEREILKHHLGHKRAGPAIGFSHVEEIKRRAHTFAALRQRVR
jgi:hypothetical protein